MDCSRYLICHRLICLFFFFNDTATTEIYTLSLHDALPISPKGVVDFIDIGVGDVRFWTFNVADSAVTVGADRKSTRLNSSHSQISYAVFCLKKKKSEQGLCVEPEDFCYAALGAVHLALALA